VDPVSRILLDRERHLPHLGPFAILAIVLHGAAAGAAYLVARADTSRPTRLPSVAVRLVQPPSRRPASSSPPGPVRTSRPQPTPAPRPTAAPTAAPAAPTPRPVPTSAAPAPSDQAMPAPAGRHTPAPTPVPSRSGGGGSRGLSLGNGPADGGEPAIPSDFQFTYYVDRMLALIESRWYKPPAPPGTRARVRFRILRDGRVEAIQLETSSGVASFDRAALRALYAANPLPPLPPAYLKTSLTVHLTFSE
jgi:TonB family protein